MAKKRVYVETSVISYYAAWPSRDVIKLAKQQLTRMWWARRGEWELFVSPVVLEEIADGDPLAAGERLTVAQELIVLPDHPTARAIADKLVAGVPIPTKAKADAAHLALAAFHGMDYLVTWNLTHLDTPPLRGQVNKILEEHGFSPAMVLTPEHLLDTTTIDDRDPVEEIRAVRAKIWRKYKTLDAYWDHLKTIPSADVLLEQIQKKIEKAKARAARPKRRSASRRQKSPDRP